MSLSGSAPHLKTFIPKKIVPFSIHWVNMFLTLPLLHICPPISPFKPRRRTISRFPPFCPTIGPFEPSRRGLFLKAHAAIGGRFAPFPHFVRSFSAFAPRQEPLHSAPFVLHALTLDQSFYLPYIEGLLLRFHGNNQVFPHVVSIGFIGRQFTYRLCRIFRFIHHS